MRQALTWLLNTLKAHSFKSGKVSDVRNTFVAGSGSKTALLLVAHRVNDGDM